MGLPLRAEGFSPQGSVGANIVLLLLRSGITVAGCLVIVAILWVRWARAGVCERQCRYRCLGTMKSAAVETSVTALSAATITV